MISRIINGVEMIIDVHSQSEIYLSENAINTLEMIGSKIDIKSLLNKLSHAKYVPLYLAWEITSICNFNCPFCYIKNRVKAQFTPWLTIKPFIDFLINEGLLFVSLTGGEIFLHPEFIDIYLYLKKHGIIVELNTNLYLLNDDILKILIAYKPYSVEVSIYGIDETTFHQSTSTTLNYNTVLSNIIKLRENNIKVICKTFVTKLNYREIDSINEWCKNNGIEYYTSSEVVNGYDSSDLSEFSINEKVKKLDNNCVPKGIFGCVVRTV